MGDAVTLFLTAKDAKPLSTLEGERKRVDELCINVTLKREKESSV